MQQASDAVTLLDLWAIVSRRRRLIWTITGLCLVAAIATTILCTRRYRATGEIQVQKDSADSLGLDTLMGGAENGAADALDANVTLQTQAKILESESLGLKVVNDLHLANSPDFKGHFSLMGWLLRPLTPKGPADPKSSSLEATPGRRDRIFAVFKANTKVVPVSGTRLIDISYTSADPRIAAAVVNHLIESLTDYNFQTRYTATTQVSGWLAKQLSDLRTSSEGLQAKVGELQRSSGVFTFGGEDMQGKQIAYSTALDQLQQTTANLIQAQSNMIVKGALYQAAKTGDPEMISGLGGSTLASGASPAAGVSLALIQTLRGQEATQKAQISEATEKFGTAYPKLEEMRASLGSLDLSIRAEQGRLQEQTKNDFMVAKQVEEHTEQIFTQQKKAAEASNDKAVQYEMLRQEAEQSRDLYQRLLGRLKEAGLLEGLRSSNITIVEPGRIPSRPAVPDVKLYLAAALFGGLFLGVGSAFGIEIMNSKVHDLQVTENRFGDALFGDLPFARAKPIQSRTKVIDSRLNLPIFALADPGSPYSEAVRGLRTALLLARGGSPPKVLLITSSVAGEGKSTLATNLATLLAQQGKRVLLVDADLRKPIQHGVFGLPNTAGLSHLLASELPQESPFTMPLAAQGVAGLMVLPAGLVPPYPSELLGSVQMRKLTALWRERFDFIVFDGAPILSVTDSVVLAPLADQILLVARDGYTERAHLDQSFRLLQTRAPGVAIGVVVNAVRRSAESYKYQYGYGKGSLPA
jgi:polysaccharide biosynthesis transport protein